MNFSRQNSIIIEPNAKSHWILEKNNQVNSTRFNYFDDEFKPIKRLSSNAGDNSEIQSIDLAIAKMLNTSETEKIFEKSINTFEHDNNGVKQIINYKQAEQSRQHVYLCLCTNLMKKFKSSSTCKLFFRSLFAYPLYYSLFITLIVLGVVGVLSYYSYLLIQTRTLNNSYFSKCNTNSDCNGLVGLGCSSENGLCNCPASFIKGRCDCTLGNYWNGTKCTPLMQYMQSGCIDDFNCDQTKELKCVNQTCQCVAPKYWNTTTAKCDFVFFGCFFDNTGGGSWFFQAQNIYRRMYYIVDVCTNYCKNLNNNITLIWMWNNVNFCHCASSYVSTTAVTCDLQCVAKNGKGYLCGSSSGSWNSRAVYQNF